MSKKTRSMLFNVFKIVVSVGLLAYVLLVQVDLRALADVVTEARWGFLALAAILSIGSESSRVSRPARRWVTSATWPGRVGMAGWGPSIAKVIGGSLRAISSST